MDGEAGASALANTAVANSPDSGLSDEAAGVNERRGGEPVEGALHGRS
jgi:hypothetical protein